MRLHHSECIVASHIVWHACIPALLAVPLAPHCWDRARIATPTPALASHPQGGDRRDGGGLSVRQDLGDDLGSIHCAVLAAARVSDE